MLDPECGAEQGKRQLLPQVGLAEGLLLGQGQAMLVQLWVQVSQEDAGFHCYLLLLLVHL